MAVVGALVAAVTDWKWRKIPNWLTYGLLIFGLFFALAIGNLPSHVIGFLVGFLPSMLLFFIGSIGGGDAKLLGAIGGVVGYPEIIDVLSASIVIGGIVSLVMIVTRRRLAEFLVGFFVLLYSLAIPRAPKLAPISDVKIPFGVAIAIGTAVVVIIPATRVSPLLEGLAFGF